MCFNKIKKFFCKKYKSNCTEFNYIKRGSTYYPACEAFFLNGKTNPSFTFILDSGADISIVPRSIGEHLGFTKGQLRYLGGISGRLGYYVNETKIQLAGKKLKIKIAWATQDTVPLLLGRKDIFNKFKICFDEKNKKLIFK